MSDNRARADKGSSRKQYPRQRRPSQQEIERQQRRRRLQRWIIGAGTFLTLLVVGGFAYTQIGEQSKAAGPRPGDAISGVKCEAEMLVYHIHAELVIYDHGKPVVIPGYVGSVQSNSQPGGSCLYWLHTHSFDSPQGVIHIESPTKQIYTLGQFLDIWSYTATWDQSSLVDGSFVTALKAAKSSQIHVYVDGKPVTTGYRNIRLTAHALVTLELGTPLMPPVTKSDIPANE